VSSPPLGTALSWAAANGQMQVQFCETESGRVRGATQFLQLEQHREHAVELSVEMNLVAGKTFEPTEIDSCAGRRAVATSPELRFGDRACRVG
jgi:hypothetical protein